LTLTGNSRISKGSPVWFPSKMNVSLYVYPKEEEEEIDLAIELAEYQRIEAEEKEAVTKAINYIKEVLEASKK